MFMITLVFFSILFVLFIGILGLIASVYIMAFNNELKRNSKKK